MSHANLVDVFLVRFSFAQKNLNPQAGIGAAQQAMSAKPMLHNTVWVQRVSERCTVFYVTDGNIMYLTYASRFLISCVIQHYAPVVGCGGVEEQMHNVDNDPGP